MFDDDASTPVFLGSATAKRYTIRGALGGGGMGEVYLAHDEQLDRKVAVKVIRQDLMSNRNLARRFEREVRGLARLAHANLIRIYDYHHEADIRFYTMELVEGETLQALAADGWVTDADAAEIVAQAAEGLAHAHGKELVHRDVKPSNVLLTREGIVKVLDFGLVRFANDFDETSLTASGLVVGTLRYLPPEAFLRQKCGPPADVWQLGTLLYRLLTGVHPVEDASLDGMLSGKAFLSLPPPRDHVPGLDPELEDIVLSSLKLDPRQRPSAEAMARRLRSWLAARSGLPQRSLAPLMTRWETERRAREARAIEGLIPEEGRSVDDDDTRALPGKGASWTNPFTRLDGGSLSWKDVLVRAGSRGLASLPALTSQRRRQLGALLGLLTLALAGAWKFGGWLDAAARRLAPPSLDPKELRLVTPERLRMRFTGPGTGRWLLRFHGRTGTESFLPRPVMVNLAEGRQVSQRHREIEVPVSPPLVEAVEVELHPHPSDGSPGLRRPLDPSPAIDALLAPVDALSGGKLVELLRGLGRLRQGWEKRRQDGSWEAHRATAAKDLQALLADHGLNESSTRALASFLPAYLHREVPPGSRRARRVLPLRYLEAVLAMGQGPIPPWGVCARLLGHEWRGFQENCTVEEGWERWKALDFEERGHGRKQWVWLADRAFVANMRKASPMTQSLFFGQILPDLLRANGIYEPEKESYPESSLDLATVHDFVVDADADGLKNLGPRDCKIWLRLKMQDRAFALVLRINGGNPTMILATGALALPPVASRSRHHWLALPLDPSQFHGGSNSLSLTVEVIPSLSSTYPLAIQKGELQIRTSVR